MVPARLATIGAALRARLAAAATLAAVLALACAAGTAPAAAQGLFDTAIRVNDKAITRYEIAQRIRMLDVLGASGDLAETAVEGLIDERLQLQAAETLGLTITEEGLAAGIDEYAARANTDGASFLAGLARAGVAEETLRAFIRAGLLWREVVVSRFAARAQVSEDEVDRAIAVSGLQGGARVLLSEIVFPARTPEEAAASEARAREFSRPQSFAEFAQNARNFSASASRERGGRIDWVPIGNLPAALRAQVLALPPGGVTEPVRVPNAIGVFQLRALEERPPEEPETLALDYAEYLLPSREAAARAAGRADTCDDLYGLALGQPEEVLRREVRPAAEIPPDVARELALLDPGETSLALTRGEAQVLLMLCGRTTGASEEADRAEIRGRLRTRQLEAYAASYLAELRADAVIVDLR